MCNSCMSSTFPIAVLNGTCHFSENATTSGQCVFGAKILKYSLASQTMPLKSNLNKTHLLISLSC